MLVGIHADVSDHHPIFKDTIPLQSLTIRFFDSRHIQGRPAMLRTRTAAIDTKTISHGRAPLFQNSSNVRPNHEASEWTHV